MGPVTRNERVEFTEETDDKAVVLAFDGGIKIFIVVLDEDEEMREKGMLGGMVDREGLELAVEVTDDVLLDVANGVVDVIVMTVKSAFADAGLTNDVTYVDVGHVTTIGLINGVSQLLGATHKSHIVRFFDFPHRCTLL